MFNTLVGSVDLMRGVSAIALPLCSLACSMIVSFHKFGCFA